MKAKEKQQYSLLQNLGYLLKRCWRVSKGLLLVLLTMALLQLGTNLIELYIAPIILQKVEPCRQDGIFWMETGIILKQVEPWLPNGRK